MAPESEAARRRRFETEALPHIGALLATASRMTRNRGDAEDLVQETFLKAYRAFDEFRPGTNGKAWLFRILVNTSINVWARRTRRPPEVDSEMAEQVLAAPEAESLQVPSHGELAAFEGLLEDEVQAALEQVPEPFRIVFLLSVIEGFQYREIAEILGIPLGTVMSRLFRARKHLQASLQEYARRRGLVRE